MNEAFLSVNQNVWLQASLIMAFRITLVGAAWKWLIPGHTPGNDSRTMAMVQQNAYILFIGLLVALLTDWLLYELGLGGLYTSLGASSILAVAGGLTGRLSRHPWQPKPGTVAVSFSAVFVAVAAIMSLPNRGEWVLGGWDPGVYLNEGVYVARTGTFHPPPDPILKELDANELRLFARGDETYRECFPGIAVNQKTHAIENYFFRLTPTCVALLTQAGGLRLATRMNLVVGALALLFFMVATYRLSRDPLVALFGGFALASHPLWIYHMHVPTSEILQAALVGGLAMLLTHQRDTRTLVLLALTAFAGVLNRIDFVPFACLLAAGAAFLDIKRQDRWRVLAEHGTLIGAVLAGALIDLTLTRITMSRLTHITPVLWTVSGAALTLMAIFLSAGWLRARRGLTTPAYDMAWALAPAAVLALVCAGVLCWIKPVGVLAGPGTALRGLMPYLGHWFVLLAVLGGVALSLRIRSTPAHLTMYCAFLVAVTIMTLASRYIASVYPWATRRYVVFTLPLLAICCGFAATEGLRLMPHRRGIMLSIGCILCLLVAGANSKRAWHAWSRTEFNGGSELLKTIANQVDDDDILVVDSPKFATPLHQIYGKQVLNGREIWKRDDAAERDAMFTVLQRFSDAGRRIRFLTTTGDGLDLYKTEFHATKLDWNLGPVRLQGLIHSKRAGDFEVAEENRPFAIYSVRP